jgi:hypothetical protein
MEKASCMIIDNRTYHFKGTAKDIGVSMGHALGNTLAQNISHYIHKRPPGPNTLDLDKLKAEALPWIRSLPERFQHEFEGLAEGANIPLQRIAEWAYLDQYIDRGCSGFICSLGGHAWVGRNNDFYVPELWGYMTIREIENRIPTISFCMQGDVFAPTGLNRERLWLHHNYLPTWDTPRMGRPHMPGYVLLIEALETCSTISDVEDILGRYDRDGGMLLFCVDGKTDEYAIFECSSSQYFKHTPKGNWLVGTNHYRSFQVNTNSQSSLSRFARLEELLKVLYSQPGNVSLPIDLIAILADAEVEAQEQNFGTVYANIACPATRQVWHTFGGFPAASKGDWQQIEWPWKEQYTIQTHIIRSV